MKPVTVQEVIERLEGLGNPKALDLIKRIRTHGIAPPDGYALVPIEPTVEMLKAGCARHLPQSIGEERMALLYRAMLEVAKELKP